MILIVLSLMAFLSAWTGGYLYYSSIKNAALEEANRQAVFHTETIKSHLSFFLYENLNSVRPSLKKMKTPWQGPTPFSIILKTPTKWMSVI
jgi:hypothetical protein